MIIDHHMESGGHLYWTSSLQLDVYLDFNLLSTGENKL